MLGNILPLRFGLKTALALVASAIMGVLLLPGAVSAQQPAEGDEAAHPCPNPHAMIINVNATTFNESQSIDLEKTTPSGGCAVRVMIRPAGGEGATTRFGPNEACLVTATPEQYQTGLSVKVTTAGVCDGLEVGTRISVFAAQTSTGVSGASGSGRRLALSKIIGWDPPYRPMINQITRLAWSYTSNDVTEWTWDGPNLHLETWVGTTLSEGKVFVRSRRAAKAWQDINWVAATALYEGLRVDAPVSIRMKTTVWGGYGGSYSCDHWNSGWKWSGNAGWLVRIFLSLTTERQCWASVPTSS